jgi:hypothetical protein
MSAKICLLDLNYTLVSNSDIKKSPFSKQIQVEEYRADLLAVLKDRFEKIFLLTARPKKYEDETLDHLWEKLRWEPNEWYFNFGATPPIAKETYLVEQILPTYGRDPSLYFGVESNPKTREMYARYGIKSQPYKEFMKHV